MHGLFTFKKSQLATIELQKTVKRVLILQLEFDTKELNGRQRSLHIQKKNRTFTFSAQLRALGIIIAVT